MKSNVVSAAIFAAGLVSMPATAALAEDQGFYLRVDAGGAMSRNPGGNIYAGTGFGHDFGNTVAIGGGFGYVRELSPMFDLRADLTVTGYPNYVSTASANFGAGGSASTLSAKLGLDSAVGLASVYLDWKTQSMVTPYIGFGAGVAGINLHPIIYSINSSFSGTENGSTVSNFAYSAIAGVALHVAPAWAIDIAYHYVNAGDVRSSGIVTGPLGTTVSLPALKGTLESHAFSVGFRLAI